MTAPSLSVLFPSYDPPYYSFANTDELRALSPVGLDATDFAFLGDTGLFVWSPDSIASDDGQETIKPDDLDGGDPGRWIATQATFSAAAREAANDAEEARDEAQAAAADAAASVVDAAAEQAQAALYAAAAEAFSDGLYADTTAGLAGTTNGQFFLTVGTTNTFANLYKNVSGVATSQSLAIPSLAALATQVTNVNTALASVQTAKAQVLNATRGYLPEGWVEPNEFTNVSWTNVLGIKFFGDGFKYWPMLPDASTTLAAWRVSGGPRKQFPDDGSWWVAISIARLHDFTTTDPTTQFYVNVNTGSDSNNGLTVGTSKKTVESAITAINAGSAGSYQINVTTADFIPGNAEGWTSSFTVNSGRKIKIYGVPLANGSKPWRLSGMRRSGYGKANFAWSNIGDGWWKSTAVGISASAKNTPIVFDISVLDENGMPTPSVALTGTLANDAAVKAAGDGRPAFFYRSSDGAFYVKLASGAEPDPGINFAYVEGAASLSVNMQDGSRLLIENFRSIYNAAGVYGAGPFTVSPQTYHLGPTNPVYNHDMQAVFKDCETYGGSGNAFHFFECSRGIVEDCKDGYHLLDGVSQSTYYIPGNSNGTGMGVDQHAYIDGHLSLFHGENGFKGQAAINTSANTFTSHSRCNMTVLNSRGGFSNGSAVAIVTGAKCLCLNVNSFGPKYVTPTTQVYPAAYLSHGNSDYSTAIKSEIWAIHCAGMTRPNGRVFYVGSTARIVAPHFRNAVTKQVDSGGQLQDGYGGNL